MLKIVFILILFLSFNFNVSAEKITLNRERIDNIYTYYNDLHLGRMRYLDAERYSFNNNTAYCIDLGTRISASEYDSIPLSDIGISKEKADYINLVAYYGYGYPGHESNNYYMAAQEIIWNILEETYIIWVRDFNLSDKINLRTEKEEINRLIKEHQVHPSFSNEEITYVLGSRLVIEDKNNVLNKYVVEDDNVKIEDNKLILTENFSKDEIILKRNSYKGKKFLLYKNNSSQRMISPGEDTLNNIIIKVKVVNGSIEIEKKDIENNNYLKGAIYDLFDSNNKKISSFKTGEKNRISSLKIGKYYLKESVAPVGYKLDNKVHEINLTSDNYNAFITLYDEKIKRQVDIFKVYASDRTGFLKGESDIKFAIYDLNSKLIKEITTDKDGYASIILPYGKYLFKQVNTSLNYHKVPDFHVIIDKDDDRPIHKLLSNGKIKAKIRIIKKDASTKCNIVDSNIRFRIFDVKNNSYLSLLTYYPETKVTSFFTVDKNGIFESPKALEAGEYIIEEVKENMDGYLYNNQKIKINIGKDSNFIKINGEDYLEINFYNKRVKGEIEVIKNGEEVKFFDNKISYNKVLLEGVSIFLYAKEDIYENKILIYKKDELIESKKTSKDGLVKFESLPLGKYYIKESYDNVLYNKNDNIYDVDLKYLDYKTDVVSSKVVINNTLKKGSLDINKYETNTKKGISNTLIEVKDDNNIIVYRGYTDKNGKIVVKNLPYGKYYLSEVESASGYKILDEKISFKIDSENKNIDVYNERIKVPSTSSNLNYVLILLALIIFILILLYFHRYKLIILAIIIFIISFFSLRFINNLIRQKEENSISNITNENNVNLSSEEKGKYNYKYVLEIPKINLKKGILDIDNKYNKAKYNIELVSNSDNLIVLAAHNGNSLNSYFKDLCKLKINDIFYFYDKNKKYEYIISDYYEIKKDGYASIYRDKNKKTIALITCKDNTNDGQIVYIGYLL